MPTYIYKAKDGPVKTVERELVAESKASAVARIESMGLIPIWVRPKGGGHAATIVPSQRGIRRAEVSVFTRQLASMIRSGVPILRALNTIEDQTENPRFQIIIGDLEASIRDGGMLSDGMRRYPKLFAELYVNMVESGETGGVLDTMLFRIAEARENEEENRRKVQAAMAYPVLVAVVGFLTVFVLLSFFMPRVMTLFEGYEELPLITRILLDSSAFREHDWDWVLLGGGLIFVVMQRIVALDRGRTLVDGWKLQLPLIGRFLRDVELGRLARTFALLIDAGISIDQVLRLSANAVHNAVIRREVDTVRKKTVQQGVTLSDGFKASSLFPPFVGNMLAVGEETGRLDESLNEVARFYESSVERKSRMATSLVEPVLLLVVGCVVGFIVFAMLLPIFEIGSGLR